MEIRGAGHKPNPVPGANRGRSYIWDGGYPPPQAILPGDYNGTGSSSPPIRSCSGWGLPSQPGRPACWWALTPPFHPYPSTSLPFDKLRAVFFLWHFPGVAPAGCYPAPCPVEFGLSSNSLKNPRPSRLLLDSINFNQLREKTSPGRIIRIFIEDEHSTTCFAIYKWLTCLQFDNPLGGNHRKAPPA